MNTCFRCAIFALIALSSQSLGSTQKPVRTETIFIDFAAPPDSIEKMTDASAAVVVASFTGQERAVERSLSVPDKWVETVFGLEVIEIVKNHTQLPLPGGALEISLPGGEKDYGDHVRKTVATSHRSLRPSHHYLVFLQWRPTENRFIPPWGPYSIYELDGSRVTALLESANLKAHKNKTTTEVLAAARRSRPR